MSTNRIARRRYKFFIYSILQIFISLIAVYVINKKLLPEVLYKYLLYELIIGLCFQLSEVGVNNSAYTFLRWKGYRISTLYVNVFIIRCIVALVVLSGFSLLNSSILTMLPWICIRFIGEIAYAPWFGIITRSENVQARNTLIVRLTSIVIPISILVYNGDIYMYYMLNSLLFLFNVVPYLSVLTKTKPDMESIVAISKNYAFVIMSRFATASASYAIVLFEQATPLLLAVFLTTDKVNKGLSRLLTPLSSYYSNKSSLSGISDKSVLFAGLLLWVISSVSIHILLSYDNVSYIVILLSSSILFTTIGTVYGMIFLYSRGFENKFVFITTIVSITSISLSIINSDFMIYALLFQEAANAISFYLVYYVNKNSSSDMYIQR